VQAAQCIPVTFQVSFLVILHPLLFTCLLRSHKNRLRKQAQRHIPVPAHARFTAYRRFIYFSRGSAAKTVEKTRDSGRFPRFLQAYFTMTNH